MAEIKTRGNKMETKKEEKPEATDIIGALEDNDLSGLIQGASMELDWSDTSTSYRERTEDEAERLIMSCPSLLAACKSALNLLMNMGEPVGNQDTGRRLAAISTLSESIRKAEGK